MPALFYAQASGSAPLTYQWRLNATDIPGATNQALIFDRCVVSNSGSYQLLAINSQGTGVSAKATLSVTDSAPFMIVVPTNQASYPGGAVTFYSSADGSFPLSYQWWFNGNPLAGATTPNLSLTNISPTNGGQYSLTASNAFGIVTNPASLFVSQVFDWQAYFFPMTNANDVVDVGINTWSEAAVQRNGTVALIHTYYGTAPPVPVAATNIVQVFGEASNWRALRRDGSILLWDPTATLSPVPPLTNAVAISYKMALLADGTVTNLGFFVPAGLSNIVAITCDGSSAAALRSDGTLVGWTNGPWFVVSGASNIIAVAQFGGLYALRTDQTMMGWGSTVPAGISNIVAIAAMQSTVLALKNDSSLTGWGSYLPSPRPTYVSAIVGNASGIAAAGFIAPFISGNPSFRVVPAGTDTLISTRVTGTQPIRYQWQFNGSNLPNATNIYVKISNVQLKDVGAYSLSVTNAFGGATGLVATIADATPTAPTITLQPTNQTISRGSTAAFNVGVKGSMPFTYQWQFYGTNLPGLTNSSLVITQALVANRGPYDVVVSNSTGWTISSNATLTVLIPLAESLNTTGLVWTSSGNIPWFGQVEITHDGMDAAQSGAITDNQQSMLQTTMTGPGSISFWWKVSSEQFFDTLIFSISGVEQARISGEVDWQQRSFPVASGVQTLTWVYSKDSSNNSGQDAAWVD
jgi:hypothetical protein